MNEIQTYLYHFMKKKIQEIVINRALKIKPAKIFTRIIEKKNRKKLEHQIQESPHGFRTRRITQDLIFVLTELDEWGKTLTKKGESHMLYRYQESMRRYNKTGQGV